MTPFRDLILFLGTVGGTHAFKPFQKVHHQQPQSQLKPMHSSTLPVLRLHNYQYQVGSSNAEYPPSSYVHQSSTHFQHEESNPNLNMMSDRQEYIHVNGGNRSSFEKTTHRQENDVPGEKQQVQTTPSSRQEQFPSTAQPQTLFLSQSTPETGSPMGSSTSSSVLATTRNASTSGRDDITGTSGIFNSNDEEPGDEEDLESVYEEESEDADELQSDGK